MSHKYCYWSVATGRYGVLMENCVRTARRAGITKQFHVLTDRPLEGCECYDAMQCEMAHGMFKLHYLRVGMTRLLFDYFIWLDANSIFTRNPIDVLAPLRRSAIHVPLELNLSTMNRDQEWNGVSCFKLRELFCELGVRNHVYLSRSAFWIIHREAIEQVYELAFRFFHSAKAVGLYACVNGALGYAMQMLCGNPEAHVLSCHPEVWGSDDRSDFVARNSDLRTGNRQSFSIQPAIVHNPFARPPAGGCGDLA